MPRSNTKTDTWVVVERTVRIVQRIPLDDEHYPEMNRVQAIDHELQLPRSDKLVSFVDALADMNDGEVELTERVYAE